MCAGQSFSENQETTKKRIHAFKESARKDTSNYPRREGQSLTKGQSLHLLRQLRATPIPSCILQSLRTYLHKRAQFSAQRCYIMFSLSQSFNRWRPGERSILQGLLTIHSVKPGGLFSSPAPMKKFIAYKKNDDYFKVLRLIRSYHFTTSRFPNYRELKRYSGVGSLSKLHKIVTTLEYDKEIRRSRQGKIISVFRPHTRVNGERTS